jgi:hypothetical protein
VSKSGRWTRQPRAGDGEAEGFQAAPHGHAARAAVPSFECWRRTRQPTVGGAVDLVLAVLVQATCSCHSAPPPAAGSACMRRTRRPAAGGGALRQIAGTGALDGRSRICFVCFKTAGARAVYNIRALAGERSSKRNWCACIWSRLGERSGAFLLGCCYQR